MERAAKAVERAEKRLEDAKKAQEEADRKLAEEQQRLKEEAERNPKAHGPQTELNQRREAAEKARQATEKAEADLAKAREKLAEAERKLEEARRAHEQREQEWLEEFLRRNPLPNTAEGIDGYLKRMERDPNLSQERRDRLRRAAEAQKKTLEESSARTSPPEGESFSAALAFPAAPAGSRIILAGSVVAEEEATLTVVGPQGQRLSGVVVDLNGEPETTGGDGRVIFAVGSTLGLLRASLPSIPDHPGVEVPVVSAPPATLDSGPPAIEHVSRFPAAGSELPIAGQGFAGDAAGNTVTAGRRDLPVLAASPTGLVVATPADALGDLGPLVVTTDAGSSEPIAVTFVRLRLEGGRARLARGQSSVRRVFVEGTQEPVPLRITNLSPAIVHLEGGEAVAVATSGGKANAAQVRLTGVVPGDFQLNAEVVDDAPPATDAKYWEDWGRRYGREADEAQQQPGAGDDPGGARTQEGVGWSNAGHEHLRGKAYEAAAQDFERAAEAFEKAARTAQSETEHVHAGAAWEAAGDQAMASGDSARAVDCYRKAAHQFDLARRSGAAEAARAKIPRS
ncbi:MAG TPA: hypothetical protein VIC28_16515 [Thermoanaerobaculia bacterium]